MDDKSNAEISHEEIQIPMRNSGDNNSLSSRNSMLLHFSDGTVLVEEQADGLIVASNQPQSMSQPNDSNRVGIRHKRWRLAQMIQSPSVDHLVQFGTTLGRKTLKVCDYVGGGVASLLGITDPKFSTEINYMNDQEKSDQSREQKLDREMQGWKPRQPEVVENQV